MTKHAPAPQDSQEIRSERQEPTFYAMIPKMAIADLDPYELALYCNYKQTSGERGKCTKSNATLARECRMSVTRLKEARIELEHKGYIRIIRHPDENGIEHIPSTVVVRDLWALNHQLYAQPSRAEEGSPGDGGSRQKTRGGRQTPTPQSPKNEGWSPDDPKEDLNKKNQIEEEPNQEKVVVEAGDSNQKMVSVEETTTPTDAAAEATPSQVPPPPSQHQQEMWNAAFNQLEMQLDRASFETWLRGALLLGIEARDDGGEQFVIGVRNTYARDMLQHRLYRNVRRVLSDVYCGVGQTVELRFEVNEPAPGAAPATEEQDMPLFRLLADQQPAMTLEGETVRALFARFISPITEKNEASVKLLEAQYSPEAFGYALSVMAEKQAAGNVKDPLSYTQGILHKLK